MPERTKRGYDHYLYCAEREAIDAVGWLHAAVFDLAHDSDPRANLDRAESLLNQALKLIQKHREGLPAKAEVPHA